MNNLHNTFYPYILVCKVKSLKDSLTIKLFIIFVKISGTLKRP